MLRITATRSSFQSTLLMRGATPPDASSVSFATYFNPLSSCEERRLAWCMVSRDSTFQSTLLMRGATDDAINDMREGFISIHAPHARSDPL